MSLTVQSLYQEMRIPLAKDPEYLDLSQSVGERSCILWLG
uniref:Uncharacterized protein n=1 Tax=Arundo donax TaxID=35708 RepID=A0A0A9F3G9_ARUDO